MSKTGVGRGGKGIPKGHNRNESRVSNRAVPHPDQFLDICIPVEDYHGTECPKGHVPGKYSPWFEDGLASYRTRYDKDSPTIRSGRVTCLKGHRLASKVKDDKSTPGYNNTYFRPNGSRECKMCRNRLKREAYQAKNGYSQDK